MCPNYDPSRSQDWRNSLFSLHIAAMMFLNLTHSHNLGTNQRPIWRTERV